MHPTLAQILQTSYAAEKAAQPYVGRRALVLNTLYKHWPTSPPPKNAEDVNLESIDDDPFDLLDDDDAPGILLRTDFSDDETWDAFYLKFVEAERDILESITPPQTEPASAAPKAGPSAAEGAASPTDADMHEDYESDSSSAPFPVSIVKVLNPTIPAERQLFENISNIAALRLINDVDLRPAPLRPVDSKKIQSPHPLISKNDWQEIYTGKTIWIYDAQSRKDECVRLVSPSGDLYGTATGDSWRARITHICELQFNMTYLGMKIDFNGLDKWDCSERQRNLRESETPIV